jgi:hypothetical protein
LKSPVADKRLETADVGNVVHVYRNAEAYEVEFVALAGRTAFVVTVEASQVRPVAPGEIPPARELVAA